MAFQAGGLLQRSSGIRECPECTKIATLPANPKPESGWTKCLLLGHSLTASSKRGEAMFWQQGKFKK